MLSFNEFVQLKSVQPICESLVSHNVDVDALCEAILEQAKELNPKNPQAINELWRGLGGLFGAGKQAVTNAGAAAAQKVADVGAAAGRGVMQAGKFVADKAGQAVDAATGAVKGAAQGVADIYQSAEHQGKVKDAMGRVAKLKAELEGLGFSDDVYQTIFTHLNDELQGQKSALAANRAMRVGSQGVVHRSSMA